MRGVVMASVLRPLGQLGFSNCTATSSSAGPRRLSQGREIERSRRSRKL